MRPAGRSRDRSLFPLACDILPWAVQHPLLVCNTVDDHNLIPFVTLDPIAWTPQVLERFRLLLLVLTLSFWKQGDIAKQLFGLQIGVSGRLKEAD